MANRRYIDFPIASSVGDSDIILIWQSGANKQTTKATFLSGLPENLDELNDVAISGLTNGQILRYDSVTGKWENTDQGNLDLNDLNDVSIVSPSNGQVLVYNSSTSKWENSSGGFVPYVGAVTTVDLGAQGLRAGYVRFDTSVVSVPDEQGLMYWDGSKSTVALIMNGTLQHIGQDTFFYCKNSTGSSIPKGTSVRFAGTDGASGHILITPFLANGSVPSNYFIGVTAEVIGNGSFGQVMHFGELDGINTSGYTAGALLYASTTVAGAFQTTVPVAPNNIVLVAAAVNSKNNGAIVVRPTYGSNINTDEGVKITSGATGDLLQLQAGGLWENKTVAQVVGSAYVPSTRTITINGTSQDLSANRTYNVGTVTSVGLSSATSGVTIGSTPVTTSGTITLTIATASGSQNGLLSSTDWTTFNGKQNALTNPVTGTGDNNYIAKFTSTGSTIGNSQIFDTGSEVRIFTTSTDARNFTLGVYGVTWDNTLFEIANAVSVFNKTDSDNGDIIGFRTVGLQRGDIRASPTSFTISSRTDLILGSNNTEAMRIFAGGNTHIGPTPASDNGARLQVSGTASVGTLNVNTTTSGERINVNGAIGFQNSSSVQKFHLSYFNGGLNFTETGVADYRLFIKDGGNVGIGTASPSYTLDVVKSISGDHIAQIRNSSTSGFGLLVKNGDNSKSAFRVLNSTDNVVFDVYGSGNVLIGTATNGASKLRIVGLPTSSAGLSSGDVYSDSGTLKIA